MTSTETTTVPGRRLGKRAPSNRPALKLGPLLTGVIPTHPLAADHLGSVSSWVLGANDRYGTCGPTSVSNFVRMVRAILAGQDVTVTDEQVFDLYRRSGNPDFNPSTGAGDNGVDMQAMLEAWLSGGLEVTHVDGATERVVPVAFAKVDQTNLDEVRAAVSIFGGCLFGVDLETAQQAQTDAGLWDYRRSSEWGGHAIMAGRYTSAVKGADIAVVTWAEIVATTDAFEQHQLGECWVVILPEHLAHPAFQDGVDLAALAADFKALSGRDLPVPTPPSPPTPPGPVPPAPPQPDPIAALKHFLTKLVGEIESFIKSL